MFSLDVFRELPDACVVGNVDRHDLIAGNHNGLRRGRLGKGLQAAICQALNLVCACHQKYLVVAGVVGRRPRRFCPVRRKNGNNCAGKRSGIGLSLLRNRSKRAIRHLSLNTCIVMQVGNDLGTATASGECRQAGETKQSRRRANASKVVNNC